MNSVAAAKLIELFYDPGNVFAGIKENSWVLPFITSLFLSLLSALLILNATGGKGIVAQGFKANPNNIAFGMLAGLTLNVLKVLVICGALLWVLRLAQTVTSFVILLGVCSYAEYAYQLFDFLLKWAVIVYRRSLHIPFIGGSNIRTNATVFLDKTIVAGPLHSIAQSLDVMTIGFFLLVGFGLTKTLPTIPFSRAVIVALTPWALWTIVMVVGAMGY